MPTTRSAVPIFAAVLLLLPLLYVGSYLALVVPKGILLPTRVSAGSNSWSVYSYRYGGAFSRVVFYPLEQIDRRVRGKAWESGDLRRFGSGPLYSEMSDP